MDILIKEETKNRIFYNFTFAKGVVVIKDHQDKEVLKLDNEVLNNLEKKSKYVVKIVQIAVAILNLAPTKVSQHL